MRTTIKICGIRDVRVARAALSLGADYLGLVVTPSRRQVALDEVQRIADQVSGDLIVVGRDVDESLLHQLLDLPVRGIQLHGTVPSGWIHALHQIGKIAVATSLDEDADIVLLDGPNPGSGEARDWKRPSFRRPIWIAGGLYPHNVGDVVSRLRPDGVDVSTGVERQGEKSLELIQQFIEEVRHADQESA